MHVVEDAAQSIIDSGGADLGPLAGLYRGSGLQPPAVQLSPADDDIPLPTHRALLRWWAERCAPDRLPEMELITPDALKAWLGRLIVLEPVDDGRDFRYRLYGSIIARFVGIDFTGKLLSETQALRTLPDITLRCHLATFRAVLLARRPLYMSEGQRHSTTPYAWHRLLLPFADTGGAVARVLLYTVPCEADGTPLPAWHTSQD